MKNMLRKLTVLTLLALLFSGCGKKNEENMSDIEVEDSGSGRPAVEPKKTGGALPLENKKDASDEEADGKKKKRSQKEILAERIDLVRQDIKDKKEELKNIQKEISETMKSSSSSFSMESGKGSLDSALNNDSLKKRKELRGKAVALNKEIRRLKLKYNALRVKLKRMQKKKKRKKHSSKRRRSH